eukprot:COSAG02_NODE_5771_length_4050_cov_2.519109_6_plen_24_part_01
MLLTMHAANYCRIWLNLLLLLVPA